MTGSTLIFKPKLSFFIPWIPHSRLKKKFECVQEFEDSVITELSVIPGPCYSVIPKQGDGGRIFRQTEIAKKWSEKRKSNQRQPQTDIEVLPITNS